MGLESKKVVTTIYRLTLSDQFHIPIQSTPSSTPGTMIVAKALVGPHSQAVCDWECGGHMSNDIESGKHSSPTCDESQYVDFSFPAVVKCTKVIPVSQSKLNRQGSYDHG